MEVIDLDSCNISIEECDAMIKCLKKSLFMLREKLLSEKISIDKEIEFFKEIKPSILGLLLYFNKIYNIEIKCPIGSYETQKNYYDGELKNLTFFFERNLDFLQYYRTNATYLDKYYFVRGKVDHQLCVDSAIFIADPHFSTGYDYKVAKIICNEMLRIYLNKKKLNIDTLNVSDCNSEIKLQKIMNWTGSKIDLIELGYSLFAGSIVNNGNTDLKEIMNFLELNFNIDLGDYYRTYVSIKNRKKDRTPFLNKLIESLNRKMDRDDSE